MQIVRKEAPPRLLTPRTRGGYVHFGAKAGKRLGKLAEEVELAAAVPSVEVEVGGHGGKVGVGQ